MKKINILPILSYMRVFFPRRNSQAVGILHSVGCRKCTVKTEVIRLGKEFHYFSDVRSEKRTESCRMPMEFVVVYRFLTYKLILRIITIMMV